MDLAAILRQKLQEGVVKFTYKKVNGDIREATGTRNFNHIPEEANPKGTGVVKPGIIAYYDLDVQGWRSCYEDQLVDVQTNEKTTIYE